MRLGSPTQTVDCRPQCGQVDDRRDAREVLEDHAGRRERNVAPLRLGWIPTGQTCHVVFGDELTVDIPQDGLEQHLDREGHAVEALRDAG